MSDFDQLVTGYHRFRETGWAQQRNRWRTLADGQSPGVMVIACSDSRVDPATIFDTLPGEMFVVRNVAALVPSFEQDGGRHGVSAALEFAVTQLGVGAIVVLGHQKCGGVAAALSGSFAGQPPGAGGFIDHWVDLLDDARAEVLAAHGDDDHDARLDAMEHAAVRTSLANLRTFPFIPEREAAGTLKLHGARFAISNGVLEVLDEATGQFSPA